MEKTTITKEQFDDVYVEALVHVREKMCPDLNGQSVMNGITELVVLAFSALLFAEMKQRIFGTEIERGR